MYDQHKGMLEMSRNPQWDYGPELMELVAEMVEWSSDYTGPDALYENPELFTISEEEIKAVSIVADPEFRHCLTSNPSLVQVSATDPFFNNEVFNLELIREAYTSKANAKCSSWKTLYSMMIRTDSKDDYTQDIHTKPFISAAFRKLHTLSESCVDNLHLYLNPNPVDKTDLTHWKQKTLFEAGKYIISKIKVLNVLPAAKSNNNGNGRTPNGLVVLQKRIWETLLCCLMMQNSFFIEYLEHCMKTNTFPDESTKAASKMSRYNRERSLFKEGDVKDINSTNEMKEWGKTRLAAFGSMAIFFLYGASGWWHCLPDSHNFNQRDVWSLVHLAHARHEWLHERMRVGEPRNADTPWYQIDSFVRWLLRKTNMHCLIPSEVDWESAPRFWAQHVNEKTVSRLAIQDIMKEVCKVQPMKTMNFKGEEAPNVKIRRPSKKYADNLKYQAKSRWTPLIDAYHQRVEDEDDKKTTQSPSEKPEVEDEEAEPPRRPSGVSAEAPLFRPASPSPSQSQTGHSGHSAYSLPKAGKIRTPRSKTESDEDDDEEDQSLALSSRLHNQKGEGSSDLSNLSSESEQSGTDPFRSEDSN
ncbi:Golgi to ER traffic- protein [Puccinia graminis f. sp. tritici]|uniref:Golgi to ER traffic-protein n=1 Tax=Puccinia graminis f. sp. tritici TaxID=56615 RepID=A0A5B0MSP6_PUCGR|nr:Golgi to ER traffic- protein [Puccinia graminis f. sp. tritici]